MDNDKDVGSIHRPPMPDGTNYDYWKARMVTFLRSIDDGKVHKSVLKGWTHPVQTKEGTSTIELKSEVNWSKTEDEEAAANSKALNAIFNGVDKNMFRLIHTCTLAKDALEILKVAHEGTTRVRLSRLQLLTTQFENLKMKEEETISGFHMRERDIANASFALGEPMLDEKLVRKILRSLPNKFDVKVTAIDEPQDISIIKVDELIGSLQTFEMSLNDGPEKKNKSIAFVSNMNEDQSDKDPDESLSEAIALLGRKFNKVMRKFDRRARPNVSDKGADINKNSGNALKNKEEDKSNKAKGVQCHECEGYGHIRSECATFLKKQGRGMVATWSDDDSEDESENPVMGLMVKCNSEVDSSDKDVSGGELAENYENLLREWHVTCDYCKKLNSTVKKLRKEKQDLLSINGILQEEVSVLKSKIEGMIKSVRMLNNGTDMFNLMLESGKTTKDLKGLGYEIDSTNNDFKKTTHQFVPAERKSEFHMSNQLSQHVVKHVYPQTSHVQKKGNSGWKCNHCGKHGHIRSHCYRLHGYPKAKASKSGNYKSKKKEWRPKSNLTAFVSSTSGEVSLKEDWNFDSGCSRHMTGIEEYFANLKPHDEGDVTFGGGVKGKIIGSGKLDSKISPELSEVLLVEGLTANLISISQICDLNLNVTFSKYGCQVTNATYEIVMKGERTKDDCYKWCSHYKYMPPGYLTSKAEDAKFRKLMKKNISREANRQKRRMDSEEEEDTRVVQRSENKLISVDEDPFATSIMTTCESDEESDNRWTQMEAPFIRMLKFLEKKKSKENCANRCLMSRSSKKTLSDGDWAEFSQETLSLVKVNGINDPSKQVHKLQRGSDELIQDPRTVCGRINKVLIKGYNRTDIISLVLTVTVRLAFSQ
ncbi:uncharacterized protein LOC130735138 [Lotus japonicus]|uniref:uncharacterized protein LOC130735138 n=1 Tax=Lotus japonicus TaxID=34305 RepID=UPI00259047E1|nr:uncharacterized protein LOC130735138 [Lotus japonicus]